MKSKRREFLQVVGAGAAGLTIATPSPSSALDVPSAAPPPDADGPVLLVGDNIAVAETTDGKVRGYVLRGIHHFLGMPYGADTSGANRFMPPRKPKPWTDVFPALWWGNSAPQNMDNRYANKYASFRDRWNYDDVSEDCLRINVFTPAIGDGRKRPVMFWIHGGGFTSGNAIEQDGYHGENFASAAAMSSSARSTTGSARSGSPTWPASAGERFAASGNVGMLDIVAALEWVRDNIARFGGDPGNVTIMGQSGGGAKVCALTAMPSADGPLPQGGGAERRVAQDGRQGVRGEAGRVRAEGGRPDGRRDRQAAGDALEGVLRPRHEGAADSSPPRPPRLAAVCAAASTRTWTARSCRSTRTSPLPRRRPPPSRC